MTILRWLTACLICLVVGGITGAVLMQWHDRPLSGPITAAGVAFEKAVPDAGVAEATPVTLGEVKQDVAQLVADGGVPDLKPWLAKNGAHPDAVTTGTVERKQVVPGVATAGTPKLDTLNDVNQSAIAPMFCQARHFAAVERTPENGATPCISVETGGGEQREDSSLCPPSSPLSYDWHDLAGRFRLHDPDVFHPAPVFTASQRYRLAIIGIAQDGSPLRQEQVALTEIDSQGHDIGPATISDLHYSYVPAPPAPTLQVNLYGGFSVRELTQPIALFSGPLVFGAGVQWRAGPVWLGGLVLNPGIVLGTAGWAL